MQSSFSPQEAVKAIEKGETIKLSPHEWSMVLNGAYRSPVKKKYVIEVVGKDITVEKYRETEGLKGNESQG